MFTRIISIFVLIVLVTLVVVPSFAEETYCFAAVVVSYKVSSFGDFEVEVVDAKGEVWVYYADEAHIGDVVILTVFDFEELSYEDDEIVDVLTVGRLNEHAMAQWLTH